MSAQNEKPIIFNSLMVRAILDGRKTQTRRVIKKQPAGAWAAPGRTTCPYGRTGDRLWVRETWGICKGTPTHDDSGKETVYYNCDCSHRIVAASGKAQPTLGEPIKWRPSIHMPRWASRITLEVTDVRVERVQDITDEDAIAEGVQVIGRPELNSLSRGKYIHAFAFLWDSINAKRGYGWDASPWVWVIEFRRML